MHGRIGRLNEQGEGIMEDKYYKSIMNILQDYINDYCCEYYQGDNCPPKYTVSINNENMGD